MINFDTSVPDFLVYFCYLSASYASREHHVRAAGGIHVPPRLELPMFGLLNPCPDKATTVFRPPVAIGIEKFVVMQGGIVQSLCRFPIGFELGACVEHTFVPCFSSCPLFALETKAAKKKKLTIFFVTISFDQTSEDH